MVVKTKIDKIIRSKRRTLSLEITADSKLYVRAPLKTPGWVIEKAVEEKSGWIARKQNEARLRREKYPPKTCDEGESFVYLGKEYTLCFNNNAKKAEICGKCLVVPQKRREDIQRVITDWYINQAKLVLTKRAEYYSAKTGLKFSSLKITGALTRWGSCSRGAGLCFTWRLVMAPVEMIDYVVVHELCHIIHPNHSKAFWQSVENILPDYILRRDWFKQNASLMRKDFFAAN